MTGYNSDGALSAVNAASAETIAASADETAYTEDDLTAMTIAEIKALAESLGYSITATKKADIIQQFLEQQEVTA